MATPTIDIYTSCPTVALPDALPIFVHGAAGGDPGSGGRRGGPRPRRRGAHRPPVPAGQRDATRRRPRRGRARRGSRSGTVGGGRDVPSAARAGGGAVSTAIEIATAVRAGERSDRKSGGSGQSVSVRLKIGGRRLLTKTIKQTKQ